MIFVLKKIPGVYTSRSVVISARREVICEVQQMRCSSGDTIFYALHPTFSYEPLALISNRDLCEVDVHQLASTRLTIPSTGSAEATGQITGIPGVTTRVAIFLYLEIYVNSTWSVVASENQTYDSYLGSLQADFPVSSGYSYRIRASYYAFCDSASENLVRYSNIVYH